MKRKKTNACFGEGDKIGSLRQDDPEPNTLTHSKYHTKQSRIFSSNP
jgi:hypothetical protein